LFSDGHDDLDALSWVACFLWVACAAIRLARFNTTIDPTADKRYFTGLPSPGAAGVVLASVYAFADQLEGRDRLWMLLVVVVPGLLMVSNVRYRSFRSLVSPKSGRPYGLVVTVLLVLIGLFTVPMVTCCVVAYSYLVSPLVIPVLAPLGRLVPARVKEVLS
jgi:CDP-diacylglycerol--serine O-phosphatidyltransferase